MRIVTWLLGALIVWALAMPPAAYSDDTIQRYGGSYGWSYVPYNAAKMRFGLNPQQAMARVRTWAGDLQMPLELAGIASIADDNLRRKAWPTYNLSLYYMFRAADDSRYLVGIHPWTYIQWYDQAADTAYTDDSPKLTREQQQDATVAFLSDKTPNLTTQTFRFALGAFHVLIGDVWHGGREARVRVHPVTGRVISCSFTDSGMPDMNLAPQVTVEQATSAAEQALLALDSSIGGFASPPRGRPVLYLKPDWQTMMHRLIWVLNVSVFPTALSELNYLIVVYVDAHTGEVIEIQPTIGAGEEGERRHVTKQEARAAKNAVYPLQLQVGDRYASTVYPPLRIGKTTCIWAGMLRAIYLPHPASDVRLNGSDLSVRTEAASWKIGLGSRHLYRNARKEPEVLSSAVILHKDRAYIPLDAFCRISGTRAEVKSAVVTLREVAGK